MTLPSAEVLDQRRAARAEVARVHQARADELTTILKAGLTATESAQVRGFANQLPGVLGDVWRGFTELPSTMQIDALTRPGWGGMPWHSLLQCNPYARLLRWTPVPLRAYR